MDVFKINTYISAYHLDSPYNQWRGTSILCHASYPNAAIKWRSEELVESVSEYCLLIKFRQVAHMVFT